ncbi:MAG: DUF3881 family protein [Clostridiaceae bacterium]|uniref:DUF3881 family protein n=2 Tax=Clostridium TaxID=1485 RepID=A0A7X2NP15_9CLOT|nr:MULTISPECIES: DUF3881 family protein [Clostridium]MCI6140459.1 DUF3881 family protein [Clostridium sp.]MDY3232677.1 DUF3881 family protein [Clostridiaceae bacterium]MSS38434.1 DUF3881 family protein [Clostridium porci]
MHKFMRTLGFSMYQKKQDMEKLLRRLAKEAERTGILTDTDGSRLCELRTEIAPGTGVAIVGQLSEKGTFRREYYYPYTKSTEISSRAECSIQRHTERETYAGLLDEYKVGISLIFYIENSMEYRIRLADRQSVQPTGAALTGFSVQGRILLPIQKTEQQAEDSKQAARVRSKLLEAARHGDEDAIETLTMEDIDKYSMVSRRIVNEDVYSIIETCFMPCGVECDQYSVIGEITGIEKMANRITKEEIYKLRLDCNDMIFHTLINKQDLLGVPEIGRRFKGQVWMQGTVEF